MSALFHVALPGVPVCNRPTGTSKVSWIKKKAENINIWTELKEYYEYKKKKNFYHNCTFANSRDAFNNLLMAE